MILVFGGTTEGKQIASFLDEVNTPYYYSTKTEVPFSGRGISIYGALTKIELEVFCRENNIKCIINASHPFAEQLHKMVASIEIQVPIIRYERLFTKRIAHQLITYVNTYEEAISFFQKGRFQSLLALSGVQTIEKLASFWKANKSWFRILDRESSRLIAQESGFPS
ncbi:MAG: precorrin-6A/cobalt-precorrin-6A reductase, partial [Flavobacteriaceae bacterium]|nr:precorrin-6A/cobalt-precorrin-6A reductase [Flavobacteriaceae bacterium]